MFRLDKIVKPWKDAGSLNANVNLYGFWDDHTFLTKSGDLGMVLRVCGVDFESLDQAGQEIAVRRLEAALKPFGPGFHVYQYLFKTNRPNIPFARYGDPLIDAAVEQRRDYFEHKRDRLYSIEIFYAVVLEGARSKTGVTAALGRFCTCFRSAQLRMAARDRRNPELPPSASGFMGASRPPRPVL